MVGTRRTVASAVEKPTALGRSAQDPGVEIRMAAPPTLQDRRGGGPEGAVCLDTAVVPESRPRVIPSGRLSSLDAYRGFLMLVLVSGAYDSFGGGFGFERVAGHFSSNSVWHFLATQFTHVAWRGCSFWDLLMPAFVFIVGVAIPYSYAARRARGYSDRLLTLHTLYRSAAFLLLGVVGLRILENLVLLRWPSRLDPNFVSILPQLGLGYALVFCLVGKTWRVHVLAAVGLLAGYWLAFVCYPLPSPSFDYSVVGVPADFEHFTGFFAHWNKNSNMAAAFDRWFLNLLPRSTPFLFHANGVATLNFIPTMATMIFGLMTGEYLRSPARSIEQFTRLIVAGFAGVGAGVLLDLTLCPVVKSLWTPSWVVYSTGWALLIFAVFFWVIEVRGRRRWAFPLLVVGMNALTAYCLANIADYWIGAVWAKLLFAQGLFSGVYGPVWKSLALMLSVWVVCLVLYRRRIFLRI